MAINSMVIFHSSVNVYQAAIWVWRSHCPPTAGCTPWAIGSWFWSPAVGRRPVPWRMPSSYRSTCRCRGVAESRLEVTWESHRKNQSLRGYNWDHSIDNWGKHWGLNWGGKFWNLNDEVDNWQLDMILGEVWNGYQRWGSLRGQDRLTTISSQWPRSVQLWSIQFRQHGGENQVLYNYPAMFGKAIYKHSQAEHLWDQQVLSDAMIRQF